MIGLPKLLSLCLLAWLLQLAQASVGDSHPTYTACVDGCTSDGCVTQVQDGWRHSECDTLCKGHTDRWLRRFRWDCPVRCIAHEAP
jgi:hypothetical protein